MNDDFDDTDDFLSGLNDRQKLAATHGFEPLLIVAGAGTGKTTTLSHRVAHLIATGVDPRRILLLTFTRRAAAEMLRRVNGILGGMEQSDHRRLRSVSGKVWGGTFHSVASRLLRQHGKLIGLPREFTILDRGDSEDLMQVLRADLRVSEAESRFPLKATCIDIYSRCVNTQQPLQKVLESFFPWCEEHAEKLKELFRGYVDRKEELGVVDYDDLLLFWCELLAEEAGGERLRDKFDCVLVDEYQDTNILQAEILRRLKPDGLGVTVVGDDAQSIYSFRAATVRNILDFPQQYAGTTVITLEQNYRSSPPILAATNAVIALAAERHAKELWSAQEGAEKPQLVTCFDEDEQTDLVIGDILERREQGVPLRNQAVLFRASHHSLALEVELSRRNVPFHKYGGLKFIETAHVKDLLAFLRLAENPRDRMAGMRVLMLLPGIGNARASALLDSFQQDRFELQSWKEFRPPAAAQTHWPLFLSLLQILMSSDAAGLPSQLHHVRRFYAPLLEKKYDQSQARLRDLEQLEQISARFEDRSTFLAEITLDPPASTQDLSDDATLDEDFLILSTIHSAKGLEWDSVYVIHAADGNIPSDLSTRSESELEEERRLFYVALSRAKERLVVSHPQRYYFHPRGYRDSHSYAQLTRFLTTDVQQHFERRTPKPAAGDAEAEDSGVTTDQIRKRMKRMWA